MRKSGNPKVAEILVERKAIKEQFDSRWNFCPYTDTSKWLNWKRNVLNKLNLKKGDKILDYGCATCEVSEWLSAQGYDVVAVDISSDLLQFSKSRAINQGYPGLLNYCCADCEQLPFKDGTFDKIFCFDILHHLPDWKKGIDELQRVLKVGGKVLAYEPNALSPVRRIAQLRWKESSLESSFYPWTLYHIFREQFGDGSISFDQRPLNPWSPEGKGIIPSLYLRLARTKVLAPFCAGIMCVAKKQE